MTARILIIEDNPASLELMCYLLENHDCTVTTAQDGQQGLDKIQSELPDLVVCDVQLPGLDGFQIVRRIKKQSNLDHIPLIAVTAYAMDHDRQKMLNAGFDGIITKPITPETFAEQILAYIPAKNSTAGLQRELNMTTILVVDDHPTNREFLVTLLGYRGYRVLEAGDGAEALEKVRAETPALVIADILMPTMDGYQFVRQLRDDPSILHIPVIFYTATYLENDARVLAKSCGVTHVLTKPSDPELVLKIVDDILKDVVKELPSPPPEEFDRKHLRLMTDKLARVADDLGQVNEQISELIEINLQLASERNPKQLLEKMCHGARKLIGTSNAILAVGKKNGTESIFYTTSGIDAETVSKLTPPMLREGILGNVFNERRTCRGIVTGADPRQLGLSSAYPRVHTFLAAPIISIQHTYGWVCLTERISGGEFNQEDEHILGILAAQVGRIYENGSLYAELQENEERFRQLAENIHEVFFLIDPDARQMLYVSPAFEDIWGRSCDSLYTEPKSWLDAVHPDDQDSAEISFRQMGMSGEFDVIYRIVRPEGDLRWIHARGFPIYNTTGELYRVAGIAEDITEQKLSEEKIKRLNRVYAVLSRINTTIVHTRDRQELFNEACRIAVEEGQFRMAWIGLLSDEEKVIVPQATAGHVDEYLQNLPLSIKDTDYKNLNASGQALLLIRPVVTNYINNSKEDYPWREEALSRGYQSVAALPLIVSDKAIGVMSLYASEPDFFDDEEMRLLNELSLNISFAMEFIKNEERLNYQANFDSLTGLVNRASLYHRLSEIIPRREDAIRTFALILINVNYFRDINDTLGHHNGDELLRQIAERLKAAVWGTDIVARLGANDFAVLLPHLSDRNHINFVIQKILKSLERTFVISNIPVNVEVSFGIALFPDHGDGADILWRHADVAERAARNLHKHYMFYDPEIDHYDPQQLALIGELRDAIDKNELVLHYQPKIDLQSEKTVGVESLIRWQHPELGLIFPDKFIQPAERTALINSLTNWVLANALRQVHYWHKNGFPLELSVNLSVRNLQNPNLGNEIMELARSFRFPLDYLTVEITESAIMVDPVHAKEVLTELSNAGIDISVDDFGIGQSSLSYLKELPVKKMKIDKSFVIDFWNQRNAAIVRSAIELGRNLELSVTAEGIEDEKTFHVLRDIGCHLGQGYYFSKALPPDQFITWLSTSEWKCEE